MKQKILEALNFRHACKIFDENKKISNEDLDYILECARLAPSSFGMEHWRLLVISNSELKEKLKPLCWNQNQITTCSHLVVIVGKKSELIPYSEYVKKMFARRDLQEDLYNAYLDRYAMYLEDKNIESWSDAQCHIIASNLANFSAFIECDSCMIGGFDKDEVQELLDIDYQDEFVSLIVALGYRKNTPPEKKRLSKEEMITYID
jgi:nitroreductase